MQLPVHLRVHPAEPVQQPRLRDGAQRRVLAAAAVRPQRLRRRLVRRPDVPGDPAHGQGRTRHPAAALQVARVGDLEHGAVRQVAVKGQRRKHFQFDQDVLEPGAAAQARRDVAHSEQLVRGRQLRVAVSRRGQRRVFGVADQVPRDHEDQRSKAV